MIKDGIMLIVSAIIPLAVGALSGFISGNNMEMFLNVNKPPLSPPGYIFPIVWTILYILMGIAAYLVYTSDANSVDKKSALTFYAVQLVVNFFWSIFFFRFEWYLFSFIWILLLWVLIFITIKEFYKISKTAAYLLIPYILWVTFAAYLNLGIFLLN